MKYIVYVVFCYESLEWAKLHNFVVLQTIDHLINEIENKLVDSFDKLTPTTVCFA